MTVRRDGPEVSTVLSVTLIGRPVSTSEVHLRRELPRRSQPRSTTFGDAPTIGDSGRTLLTDWGVSTDRLARLRQLSSDRPLPTSLRLVLNHGMRIPLVVMVRGNVFQRELMEEQIRASWNPLLAWLRDVQAWGQAAEVGV